ncbi:hypothetical protein KC332_g7161 [Hortaea werneckii]|uniref:Rhodopsin domain-containing protein n=2 Tax=Hortaea werneckii TaxID=91943 RepID=A0A3M7IKH5_HORWE|nr:hypothetical protein KC358_g7569 [Hortaea werneckii]OTA22947.1 hypothetical protein BTJ68_14402 [Hortaea werneckii EXF-2000]KAI6846790.1 hypothetical protein KC350_g3746 [Hortaea werneckii]KAI6939670.1 hypothetical protein KC348_g5227 [Hortaea werneckii]KAI6939918.1 hypothetical protein KC341_g3853 [Hortaea werneckii]
MAAATASATGLPPGYHEPFAKTDADHHGSWVIICNAFGLVVGLISLAIRAYIRGKVSPPFSLDDWILAAATFLALIQCSLVFEAVHDGFGQSMKLISADKLVYLQKLLYTSDLFYVFTIYGAKSSVILLYRRIAPDRAHSLVAWAGLSLTLLFGIISIFLVALRCDLSQPWLQYNAQCTSLSAQWAAVTAFDVISEALLVGMSVHLVWKLQMPLARKGKVVLAFALRLPLIPISIVRLEYINQELGSSNPTLTGAVAGVLTQLAIFYSLMAATLPCLRPFLAGFVTNYGAMGGSTVIGGSQLGSSKRDEKDTKGSFVMASMHSSGSHGGMNSPGGFRKQKQRVSQQMNEEMFRPDRVRNKANATHPQHHSHDASSIGSSESTKGILVQKDVTWQISEDNSRSPQQQQSADAQSAGSSAEGWAPR